MQGPKDTGFYCCHWVSWISPSSSSTSSRACKVHERSIHEQSKCWDGQDLELRRGFGEGRTSFEETPCSPHVVPTSFLRGAVENPTPQLNLLLSRTGPPGKARWRRSCWMSCEVDVFLKCFCPPNPSLSGGRYMEGSGVAKPNRWRAVSWSRQSEKDTTVPLWASILEQA